MTLSKAKLLEGHNLQHTYDCHLRSQFTIVILVTDFFYRQNVFTILEHNASSTTVRATGKT
jgi:hypothetical protein